MKVKDTTAKPENPLVFDGLFLENLTLNQVPIIDDTLEPKFNVIVSYRRYAIDSDGNRVYKEDVNEILIEDFLAFAKARQIENDVQPSNTAIAIQKLFAYLVEQKESISTLVQ